MLETKDVANDAVHDIIMYLCYNSAEMRPCELFLITDEEEELLKRLNKHFKPFLENDLVSAFQQVSGLQTEFLWKPIAAETDENNLDTSGESLENAGFLSTYFHQDQKETKKRQKKDRNNEQDRRSVSRDNETEESLRVKGERRKDTDVEEDNKKQVAFPRDDKKVKPRKHQQSARTTMKLLDAKKSLDDSRKSNREVANVEKSNVTDERKKPESKFTSAASRIQHKQSKKRQTDTEDAQIENNNTSSKNKNNHGNKKN